MYIAVLTASDLASLRPSLDTINTQLARRGNAGRKVKNRPPQAYAPGAIGWTVPTATYEQKNGNIVVVLETAAWERLNPASRALFRELASSGYPPGFDEGESVPWP